MTEPLVPITASNDAAVVADSEQLAAIVRERNLPNSRDSCLTVLYSGNPPVTIPTEVEILIEEALLVPTLPPGYNLAGWLELQAWQKHRYRQRPPRKPSE